MSALNRSKLPGLLQSLSLMNLIYSIEFTKVNGENRKMTCRGGVKKYVKNTGRPGGAARPHNAYVNVYQMNGKPGADNYRAVNIDTVHSIKTCGITAEITPEMLIQVDATTQAQDNVVVFNAA